MIAPPPRVILPDLGHAQILHELAALRAGQDELRSEIARLRVPRLSAVDHAALACLLPAIRVAVGTRLFSVGDLVDHAKLSTPEAGALRAALGTLDGGATKRLGKLFARALGVHVGGLLVQHVGDDRDGATWMIAATFPAEKPAALHDIAALSRSNRSVPTTNRKRNGA